MMKMLSRRDFMGSSVAAGAAAIATQAVAATPELDRLIAAHKKALRRWTIALDVIDEWQMMGTELFVPLTIGATLSQPVSEDLMDARRAMREHLTRHYATFAKAPVNTLEMIQPGLGRQVHEAMRKARANDLRKMRRVFHDENRRREASGYNAARRELDTANDDERQALNAVIGHRCATLAEVDRKIAYVAKTLQGCLLNEEQIDLLLTSLRTRQ